MHALQLIILVALTRASKMDSAPNFEMAFREIKTNWKKFRLFFYDQQAIFRHKNDLSPKSPYIELQST